ncbi:MAG: DUF1949 domain-containing protein [Luteimonas sp.]
MPRSAGNQPANPTPAGSPLISTPPLYTIAARTTHTVEIKRSRFLAVAVHDALAHFNGDKLDEQFDAKGAVVEARVPENDVAALKNRLRDATRDRVRIDNQG